MRSVILAIIYIVSTSSGFAEEREQADAMGAGISTCAEFAEHYRRDPTNVMGSYFSWAQGFMSASNLLKHALNQPQRALNGLPISEQLDRLRTFCDRRPLAHFGDGVVELFNQLPAINVRPQSK